VCFCLKRPNFSNSDVSLRKYYPVAMKFRNTFTGHLFFLKKKVAPFSRGGRGGEKSAFDFYEIAQIALSHLEVEGVDSKGMYSAWIISFDIWKGFASQLKKLIGYLNRVFLINNTVCLNMIKSKQILNAELWMWTLLSRDIPLSRTVFERID